MNEITLPDSIIEKLALSGDVSGLNAADKIAYYRALCGRVGLDPATQPFKLLRLSGKEVFYCDRGGAAQLNRVHGVSHTILSREIQNDCYVVTARASANGRHLDSLGAVPIQGLKGEALCNAYMKAETKAKRRATLDLLGLGMLDETEVGSIPGAEPTPLASGFPAQPELNAPKPTCNAPEAPKGAQTPPKQENAPKGQVEPQSVAIKHATETTRAWFISEFLNAKPGTNERLVCEAYFRALKWLGDDQPIDLLPLCYVPTSIGQARTILPYLGTFQQEGRAAEPWPAVNAPEPQKTGWRAHKVVWTKGKFANLPLGELPKDFLYQMWRTYEVKDTWEDKSGTHKKSEASMEKDKAFRAALDEAGKELNFREEPA